MTAEPCEAAIKGWSVSYDNAWHSSGLLSSVRLGQFRNEVPTSRPLLLSSQQLSVCKGLIYGEAAGNVVSKKILVEGYDTALIAYVFLVSISRRTGVDKKAAAERGGRRRSRAAPGPPDACQQAAGAGVRVLPPLRRHSSDPTRHARRPLHRAPAPYRICLDLCQEEAKVWRRRSRPCKPARGGCNAVSTHRGRVRPFLSSS